MKVTENNTVNEWNEGAPLPQWQTDNFWQTGAADPDENAVTDPPPPILEAEDAAAPDVLPREGISDS